VPGSKVPAGVVINGYRAELFLVSQPIHQDCGHAALAEEVQALRHVAYG
jgi:hypothetical protein